MRPVRLSLEGFTSFKEPATLDFGALDLFVIHGATGAGKSSLLDALTYALFGAIPRALSRGGVADFISLGRRKATTALEFSLQDERYRVTRTASRGKKSLETKALLERRRSADFYEIVAEGVTRVDAFLADKLHMSCDVFTQAVVLPQGQFATFLRSAPRERRQMLNELLQLQVFERMHRQASARKAELETQLDGLTRRLDEDFADVSRESLERVAAELAATTAASTRAQESLTAKRVELDQLKRQFARHQEWAKSKETLRGLVAREPEMERRAESLRLARAARAIVPMMNEADRDRTAAETLEREDERLSNAFDAARTRYVAVQAEREAAEDAADEVPALEARRRQLAEIAGKVALRHTLVDNRTATVDALTRKRTRLGESKQTLAALDAEEKKARADLAALVKERQPLPGDIDDRLERGRRLATQLGQDRQEFVRRSAERTRLEAERSTALAAVEQTSGKRRDADAKLKQAEQAHAAAVAERERRRHATLVDELRRELQAGSECPVCGQNVDHPPTCSAVVAGAEDEVAKLERRLTKLRSESSRAAAEALVAETERDRLAGLAAEVVSQVERQREQVAALEAELGRVLPKASANGSVEKAFAVWSEDVRRLRERLAQIDRDEAILTEKLAGVTRSRTATTTSLAEIDAEIRDGEQRLVEIEQSLKALDAEIATITTHADPARESEDIGRTIEARNLAQARTQREEATRAQAMEVARIERDRHRTETATALAARSRLRRCRGGPGGAAVAGRSRRARCGAGVVSPRARRRPPPGRGARRRRRRAADRCESSRRAGDAGPGDRARVA
jgi:DNA repair protein SbcC/Rad50